MLNALTQYCESLEIGNGYSQMLTKLETRLICDSWRESGEQSIGDGRPFLGDLILLFLDQFRPKVALIEALP